MRLFDTQNTFSKLLMVIMIRPLTLFTLSFWWCGCYSVDRDLLGHCNEL
ncbi:hypothetical protein DSUL_140088 [Desulfovibrionales bacterium]